MNSRGFTLVETLVALVVAAIATSVILAMVKGLMQRAEIEQRHVLDTIGLLNDSVLFGQRFPYPDPDIVRNPGEWSVTSRREDNLPTVRVRNFSLAGPRLTPPLEVAITPLQTFAIARNRHAITVIAPGLPAEGSRPALPATPPGQTRRP